MSPVVLLWDDPVGIQYEGSSAESLPQWSRLVPSPDVSMPRPLAVPLLATAFFAVLAPTAAAQSPLARMGEVRQAITAGNAAAALALLDTIAAVAPDHPNVVFLRAHANGLAGRRAEARADLTRLLRWDARFAQAALRDTNVAALRADFPLVDSLV